MAPVAIVGVYLTAFIAYTLIAGTVYVVLDRMGSPDRELVAWGWPLAGVTALAYFTCYPIIHLTGRALAWMFATPQRVLRKREMPKAKVHRG